jgi:hypothetical protein
MIFNFFKKDKRSEHKKLIDEKEERDQMESMVRM